MVAGIVFGLVAGIVVSWAIPAVVHAPSGAWKVIRDDIAPQMPGWLTAIGTLGSLLFLRWMRIRVIAFEKLDYKTVSDAEFLAMSAAGDFSVVSRFVAHIEIETRWANNRATDWRFAMRTKGGASVPLTTMPPTWGVPRTWRQIRYETLDEIQSLSLDRDKVYNIFLQLKAPFPYGDLDLGSLQVSCRDAYRREVSVR